MLERCGRRPKDGTHDYSMRRAYPALGGVPVRFPDFERPTLARFIAEHPTGRYLVIRRGHAFAVVDGRVHDWGTGRTGARSRIRMAWAFPGAQYRAGAPVVQSDPQSAQQA
jgi:hypothetical protein